MADSGKAPESPATAPSFPPAASSPPPAASSPPPAAETPAASGTGNVEAGILPATHWEPIAQQEEVLDDGDSAFSVPASSTNSLSASIWEYRTHLGRTYHSDIGKAEHWIPNDEQQLESMDMHHGTSELTAGHSHHACTLLLEGKLYLAPIDKEKVRDVLDIGTGTGIWAVDFADTHPDAEVVGTDITPIQETWVPPNLRFELEDANSENFSFKTDFFDFVHLRGMVGTIADWPKFYREAYRVCKPGGWIEHHDEAAEWYAYDAEISEKSAMGQWGRVFAEGGKRFGRTFRVVQEDVQRKGMEEAGFVDIVVKDFKVPLGSWPTDPKQRELGFWARRVIEVDLDGFVNYMWGAVMGWSAVEIQVYIAHLRKEMKEPLKTWYPHRIVYGRKPE
ncbi:hypothetical protein N0V88_007059 [Collariella sp. IMI 366227]|nr:hypothetical protein N0V88_007059 [Collariella sp. IMI 366227]